jgi:hypothetical protein
LNIPLFVLFIECLSPGVNAWSYPDVTASVLGMISSLAERLEKVEADIE